MKVLIIRAFPSLINLKSNSYNQQEIGLATAFLGLGHEAGIVYYGDDKHLNEIYKTKHGDINIYYRKAKVLLNRIALFEKFDDLKENYDFLILNEYDQYETYKTLKKYSSKCIIYHGPYYAEFNKRYNLYNKAYDLLFLKRIRKMQPCIYTKSKLAKEYLNQKGLPVEDYLGVGLDIDQMRTDDREFNPIKEKINTDNINLLYVGKLEKRRNILLLLEMINKLIVLNENYRLVLVGNGEKEYVEEIFAYIEQNHLGDYIIYQEKIQQKHLPYLYKNCNCFLLPTSYEIWGMVLMEAMHFGCPVITTYNGGSSTLIEDGLNGLILELDVQKWVEAIENHKFHAKEIEIYNKKILAEKCNWEIIAKKMLR